MTIGARGGRQTGSSARRVRRACGAPRQPRRDLLRRAPERGVSVRSASSATRNSFTEASGNTTVAMSRPSITAPSLPSERCSTRIRSRTPGCRATAETAASTAGRSARPRGNPRPRVQEGSPRTEQNRKASSKETSPRSSSGSIARSKRGCGQRPIHQPRVDVRHARARAPGRERAWTCRSRRRRRSRRRAGSRRLQGDTERAHASRRTRGSSRPRPRHRRSATGLAPPSAATAKRHGHAMVATRVGTPALEASPGDHEVDPLVRGDPAQVPDARRDRV